MKKLACLTIAAISWAAAAQAGQRGGVDTNKLANFITIKEFTHCAEFHVRSVNVEQIAGLQRAKRIRLAGDFIGAALNIDEEMTNAAMPHARQYFSKLAVNELHNRYRAKCNKLIGDSRYRTRMLDWRYRLNASQHVPSGFFQMRWEGQMPEEWYSQK